MNNLPLKAGSIEMCPTETCRSVRLRLIHVLCNDNADDDTDDGENDENDDEADPPLLASCPCRINCFVSVLQPKMTVSLIYYVMWNEETYPASVSSSTLFEFA